MKIVFRWCRYFLIGLSFLMRNGIFVITLVVGLFISLLQVSSGYREVLLEQEQEMIYEEENPNLNYYYEDVVVEELDEQMAVSKLMECYQSSIELNQIPENVKGYMDALNQLYNESSQNFSFVYQDLFSGFTVSYNEDAPIFTASAIKAPAMIYLYEKASKGEIDLSEKLVYSGNYYSNGSGILKTKPVNTSYTVEELIEYTIHYSDNAAYAMLMNRFGRENILNYWTNFGTKYIFTLDTIWGVMSAKDASIYMNELYRFSKDNEEYGGKLLDYFKKAEWKLITDKEGNYNTASKGGWSGESIHDIAIVFEENPYILIVMSKLGTGGYEKLFNDTSVLAGKMHEEYWKYKVDLCSGIKLY